MKLKIGKIVKQMSGNGDDAEKVRNLTEYAKLLLMRTQDIYEARKDFIKDAKKELKTETEPGLKGYFNGIISSNLTTMEGIESRMNEEIKISEPKKKERE